jgi:hypothetical protein
MRRERPSEKRKVGGSTPPLTTGFVSQGQQSLEGFCGDLALWPRSGAVWDACRPDVVAGERAIFLMRVAAAAALQCHDRPTLKRRSKAVRAIQVAGEALGCLPKS